MNNNLYENITDSLVDRGYIVIDNALCNNLIEKLILLSRQEVSYKKAKISSSQKSHIDKTSRSDKTQWLDEDRGTQSEYLAFMEGLREYLNRSLYLGLKYYESHFSLYEKDDFYEKHLDSFVGEKNRVLTTLLYLNDEWGKKDKGELVLYDSNSKELEKIMPKGNTMLIFLSEKFPHEVLKTKKERYAIAGWFRVDKR